MKMTLDKSRLTELLQVLNGFQFEKKLKVHRKNKDDLQKKVMQLNKIYRDISNSRWLTAKRDGDKELAEAIKETEKPLSVAFAKSVRL